MDITAYEAIVLGIALCGLVLMVIQIWLAMKQARQDKK